MGLMECWKKLWAHSSFAGEKPALLEDGIGAEAVEALAKEPTVTAADVKAIEERIAAAHARGEDYYPTLEESRVLVATKALALPPGQITKNFSWVEAMCNSGEPVPEEYKDNARKVAELLEMIRDLFGGAPVKVTSWYRSPARNEALRRAAEAAGRPGNVAKHSQHLTASAADINIKGYSPHHVQALLEAIWNGADITRMSMFHDRTGGDDTAKLAALGKNIRLRMRGFGRGAHRGFVHVDIRNGERKIFNYK